MTVTSNHGKVELKCPPRISFMTVAILSITLLTRQNQVYIIKYFLQLITWLRLNHFIVIDGEQASQALHCKLTQPTFVVLSVMYLMTNRIKARAIKNLHYSWYLKILSNCTHSKGSSVQIWEGFKYHSVVKILICTVAFICNTWPSKNLLIYISSMDTITPCFALSSFLCANTYRHFFVAVVRGTELTHKYWLTNSLRYGLTSIVSLARYKQASCKINLQYWTGLIVTKNYWSKGSGKYFS